MKLVRNYVKVMRVVKIILRNLVISSTEVRNGN